MKRRAIRRTAALGGALALLVGLGVGAATPVRAEVPIGIVSPKIAPVGALIHVTVEGECEGAAATRVTLRFVSAIDPEASPATASAYRVRQDPDGGYRLRVPDLPAGPYAVHIACGGDAYAFTDNAAGPTFTARPRVWPGDTAFAYAYYPCGEEAMGDATRPAWADPRMLLARTRHAVDAADPRLVEAEIVGRVQQDEGFYVELRVPAVPPGRYHVYTSCGDAFRLQDVAGGPAIEVLGTTDTSAVPARDPAPQGPTLPLLIAALVGTSAVAARARRTPRSP
jgi:hypothetical protein